MKKIYIISDATGQSGLHILRAAIVQFEHARAKMMVFHNIDAKARLKTILDKARVDIELCDVSFNTLNKIAMPAGEKAHDSDKDTEKENEKEKASDKGGEK